MKHGHRWLAFDADYGFSPFVTQLTDRFGATGAYVFVLFLCACKRSGTPGAITYASELDLVSGLGIATVPLVDSKGDPWSLEELFQFTGRMKQTKKTRIGARWKIASTHWAEWQQNFRREENSLRMAQKRRAHDVHTSCTEPRTDGAQDEHEMRTERKGEVKDIPPYPPNGGKRVPPAHASPPSTPATPKPPCASCGEPALLVDQGANLCMRCYELNVVIVPAAAQKL